MSRSKNKLRRESQRRSNKPSEQLEVEYEDVSIEDFNDAGADESVEEAESEAESTEESQKEE